MREKENSELKRCLRWMYGLVSVFLACLALTINYPKAAIEFVGDEAVYYTMTQSLAEDLDLRYTAEDLDRVYHHWIHGPQGILLTADPENIADIHYAKPWLYPLFVAPFFRLFHVNGFLFLHFLLLMLCLIAGYLYLKTDSHPLYAFVFPVLFFFFSPAYVYSFQLTPESFNLCLLFFALYFAYAAGKVKFPEFLMKENRPLWISVILTALSAASRPPNAVFFLPVGVILLQELKRKLIPFRWRKYLLLLLKPAAAVLIIVIFYFGVNCLLTGQWFSHSGFRKRIVGHFPFEAEGIHFKNTGDLISTESTKFVFHWSPLFHNLFYFFFGRFTGLFLYFFPAVTAVFLMLFNRKQLRQWVLATALVIYVLFHLVYIPTNYHGGSGAVGNRYFMYGYAAFFFLIPRIRSAAPLWITAIVGSLFFSQINVRPIFTTYRYEDHTKEFPFTLFPFELSLINSWPSDDPGHSRIAFEKEPSYFIYLVDDNTYGKEMQGFWVRGEREAEMGLRAWKPAEAVSVRLRNGPIANRVKVKIGGEKRKIDLTPGQEKVVIFEVDPDFVYYNLAGDPSYIYKIAVSSRTGFVPRFHDPNNRDPRYLGVFAEIFLKKLNLRGGQSPSQTSRN